MTNVLELSGGIWHHLNFSVYPEILVPQARSGIAIHYTGQFDQNEFNHLDQVVICLKPETLYYMSCFLHCHYRAWHTV